ncbi:MAG: hypothetical protein AAF902_21965 [Chloroflexota bacterium]
MNFLLLQIWGGGFYLANKILLSLSEGRESADKLKICGWAAYLIGLPAWIILLVIKQDWIAAAIEAGGAPSMILGLIIAFRGGNRLPTSLDKFAMIFAYILIFAGTGYSIYINNGITSVTQVLETGVMAGFLGGTYLLAKNNRTGWLLFIIMNGSMGLLMFIQNSFILAAQQGVSLLFVIYGYTKAGQPVSSTDVELS